MKLQMYFSQLFVLVLACVNVFDSPQHKYAFFFAFLAQLSMSCYMCLHVRQRHIKLARFKSSSPITAQGRVLRGRLLPAHPVVFTGVQEILEDENGDAIKVCVSFGPLRYGKMTGSDFRNDLELFLCTSFARP